MFLIFNHNYQAVANITLAKIL